MMLAKRYTMKKAAHPLLNVKTLEKMNRAK